MKTYALKKYESMKDIARLEHPLLHRLLVEWVHNHVCSVKGTYMIRTKYMADMDSYELAKKYLAHELANSLIAKLSLSKNEHGLNTEFSLRVNFIVDMELE